MNRIQLLDHDFQNINSPTQKKTRQPLLKTGRSSSVEHSFFVPLHYEPNYAYPLLIWLHGPNDDHSQLKRVMPHVSMRNYVAVAPSRLEDQDENNPSFDHPWPQNQLGISETMYQVRECITLASQRFNIAKQRVFLAGYGCGGTMALRLGLAEPDRFAGVASMEGPVPDQLNPLSNLLQARGLPILIAHGRDSEVYSINRICEELRLFHVAGLSLNLRQYPCGHELTTQMLGDLDSWMMQIVTGVESTPESMDYLRYDDN